MLQPATRLKQHYFTFTFTFTSTFSFTFTSATTSNKVKSTLFYIYICIYKGYNLLQGKHNILSHVSNLLRWLQQGGGSCVGPTVATKQCNNHPCPPGLSNACHVCWCFVKNEIISSMRVGAMVDLGVLCHLRPGSHFLVFSVVLFLFKQEALHVRINSAWHRYRESPIERISVELFLFK